MFSPSRLLGICLCLLLETAGRKGGLREEWLQARDDYEVAEASGIGHLFAALGWACLWGTIPVWGWLALAGVSAVESRLPGSYSEAIGAILLAWITALVVAPIWLSIRHLLSNRDLGEVGGAREDGAKMG